MCPEAECHVCGARLKAPTHELLEEAEIEHYRGSIRPRIIRGEETGGFHSCYLFEVQNDDGSYLVIHEIAHGVIHKRWWTDSELDKEGTTR